MSLSLAVANDFGSESTDVPSSSDEMPSRPNSPSFSGLLRHSCRTTVPLATYAPTARGSQPRTPPGYFFKKHDYQNGGVDLSRTRINPRIQTPPPSELPPLPPQLPPPPPPPQHAPILDTLCQSSSSPPAPAISPTSFFQPQARSVDHCEPPLPFELEGSSSSPPPGLEVEQSFPSEGSVLHGVGKCTPCAWFWKPQGCNHGSKCFRCHLCPMGEVKSRKKAKHIATKMQTAAAQDAPLTDSCLDTAPIFPCKDSEEPRIDNLTNSDNVQDVPVATAQLQLPSRGSTRHASGKCDPCAWFWKSEGCQNGQQCSRCHLCPQGEVKARRKARLDTLRLHACAEGADFVVHIRV